VIEAPDIAQAATLLAQTGVWASFFYFPGHDDAQW
jgi:hypothetical protein